MPLCKVFITFKDVFKGIFLKGVLRNIDDADVLSEKFCDSLLKESEEEKRLFYLNAIFIVFKGRDQLGNIFKEKKNCD